MLVNARELSPTEQGNLLRRFTIFMEFCIRRWLKQYAGDWFRAMYATMLNFRAWRGMRHGELLGLHWQDSNFDNGTLQVRRSVSRVRKQFQKLLVDAGLPHMRFHDLRHSAATIFMSWGVPAKVVQEILGHANISMTLGILCRQILSPLNLSDSFVEAAGSYNAALDLSHTALRAESEGERYTGVLHRTTLAFALRV